MSTLEELQSELIELNAQRDQIAENWFLQQCWLVQVKPGGTARTNTKYWQVRSRQPILDGKTLKHLKPNEVEDYKAAIARGRQLTKIDHQIKKLQQQIEQLNTTDPIHYAYESSATEPVPSSNRNQRRSPQRSKKQATLENPIQLDQVNEVIARSQQLSNGLQQTGRINQAKLAEVVEEARLVQELIANTQALRASLRQAAAVNNRLRQQNHELRQRDRGDR
ncbi:hypothetical protein H6G89_25865 [Oscillatoria sp. FACHB-1407]|uniref:hypothetical protein n=1 Tax=Oscillatoria sp. FACHB-1407 TaxID=2692847 RepID=UPI001683A363|nr:hypothetical protein [Oscillatoria sp. FACHB-1407]MBD2464438.1 hypothetical protein [Oscillatoria sp. FACHB-1407]